MNTHLYLPIDKAVRRLPNLDLASNVYQVCLDATFHEKAATLCRVNYYFPGLKMQIVGHRIR